MNPGLPLVAAATVVLFLVGGTATSSASRAASGVGCATAEIKLKLGPSLSEKTEQHTASFVLLNNSSRPCVLDGYPAVRLLDSEGKPLLFRYRHRGDQMTTNATPRPVPMPAGGTAYFELNKNTCVSFTRRDANKIRVSLPDEKGSLTLRLPRPALIDYCRPGDPGNGITLSPIEPTLRAAACLSQRACGPGSARRARP